MSEEKEAYNATPNLETDWRAEAERLLQGFNTYFGVEISDEGRSVTAVYWLSERLKHLVTLDRLRESIKAMEAQNDRLHE